MLLHSQKRNTATCLARLAVFVFLSFALVITSTAQTGAALTSATNQVSNFSAGNNATLVAQGDVSLSGTNLSAGANAYVQGVNVSVEAAKDRQALDVQNVGAHSYNGATSTDETLAGGRIKAGNNLILVATGKIGADGKPVVGTGNLSVTGAALTAGATDGAAGQAVLVANNDVTVKNATTEHTTSSESYDASRHWWGSSTSSANSASHTTQVEGATISAGSLFVQAGAKETQTGNVLIQGSQVAATNDVTISAGKDLSITAAQQTSSMQSSASSRKSGLFAGDDGASFTIGRQQQRQDGSVSTVTNVGSQLGSLSGNVALSAGNQYTQTASQVIAPGATDGSGGDIDITAKKVLINAATDTVSASQRSRFDQSGVSVAVGSPIITAAQGAARMSDAADKTSDPRLKALAAASAALGAANAVTATQAAAASGDTSGGMSVTITYQDSHSRSDSLQTGAQAVGSTLSAGRNLSINAQGAGAESGITVVGSQLKAGNDATLKAEGRIELSAAQSTTTQKQSNTSSSAGAGVALSYDNGGIGVGYTANASGARGHADGTDVSQTNTTITAGRTASLSSGGDTSLNGAVVSGNSVKADIGGNLNIQSLQDSTTLKSTQQGAGASGTYGYGSSVSASVSDARVGGDFASVAQQSGLKAGDGGFQVTVKGNTDLKGGTIASSQAAVDAGKNSLSTGTISTSDISNHDQYSATGLSLSYGSSGGSSAGFGHESGSQGSTTRSGVSVGSITITDSAAQQALTGKSADQAVATLNRDVTSAKDSGVIQKSWNGQQLMDSVQASTQITASFGANASKAVGDYAASKSKPYTDADTYLKLSAQAPSTLSTAEARTLNQLNASGMTVASAQTALNDPQVQADYQTWKEGGAGRSGLHALIGGLTGGAAGAVGAGASAGAAPSLSELRYNLQDGLVQAGVNASVAKGLAQLAGLTTATGLGAAVGGVTGASSAFNEDANNRQLHPDERTLADRLAAKSGGKYTAQQIADAMRASGNSRYGEDVTVGMVVAIDPNAPRVSTDKAIYDKGAAWNVGANGTTLVQPPVSVDPALAAFVLANTGGASSPYTDLAPMASMGSSATGSTGQSGFSHQLVTANGKTFPVPVADCPAVSCTNGDPIAWFSSDPRDQATLTAYKTELAKQGTKDAVNGTLVVGAVVLAPATLTGAVIAGAVVGGGNSATEQMVDTGSIDAGKTAVDSAKGAVIGGAVYGGVAVAGKVIGAIDGTAASASTSTDANVIAAQKIENHVTRDGGIADPSKPMSATGPWTPAAALTPAQADAAIQSALPAGAKVVGTQSADALNAGGSAKGWSPSFVPGTQIVEVTTAQPAQFVRVFGGGSSEQAGGWVMRAEDIAGLTPQQIASKFALPEVPTMLTDVTIPAGTRSDVSAANGISPNAVKTGTRTGDNGGGGGVQFQIKTNFDEGEFEKLFTNPRPLSPTGGK